MSTTPRICAGAAVHAPLVLEVDRHHIFPMYLCAALGIAVRTETAPLCSGCHDRVHHLMRHLINEGQLAGHRTTGGERILLDRFWAWWQAALVAP